MDSLPDDSLLDSRPSLGELTKYVKLASRWYEIGARLELDAEELEEIRSSRSDSESDKTISMYKLWLDSDPHATRRKLVEELEDMNLNRQALRYKGHIRSSGKYKYFSWFWAWYHIYCVHTDICIMKTIR